MTVTLFWNVTPCGPVKVAAELEETAASLFRTVGNILPDYTASHPVTDW
jgi:hypothetical protein